MSLIKYAQRKLFYKIWYYPQYYKRLSMVCLLNKDRDKIIVWKRGDYPKPIFYVIEDLLLDEFSMKKDFTKKCILEDKKN